MYCMFLKKLYSFLDDIELCHGLNVFVKDDDRGNPIEKLYYSWGYEASCIDCGKSLADADEDAEIYPRCVDCDQPKVRKRVLKMFRFKC